MIVVPVELNKQTRVKPVTVTTAICWLIGIQELYDQVEEASKERFEGALRTGLNVMVSSKNLTIIDELTTLSGAIQCIEHAHQTTPDSFAPRPRPRIVS
jgi:hypothetical protein